MAMNGGADVLIMDDGFQNPTIFKDLSLLVIDRGYGVGNGRVIPAGPLREPEKDAFERASAVVYIKTPGIVHNELSSNSNFKPPSITATISSYADDFNRLKGKRVIAFAGIGRPIKFFSTLDSIGSIVVDAKVFPDHHQYTKKEILGLIRQSEILKASLVTTEKDAVRLTKEEQKLIEVLRINVSFENINSLDKILRSIL